ncbi:hypothetical protein M0812_23402 [Anaeramoeba flamelloides]|uniref:Uncharacterized protein n=1 Tax=Anaeramoeba flamelloides TaxID=1746091 RepID=A0AAV7YKL9_9EUKA|nr:hypothetical protein M0812_23402 [Anaeramoeba flamelloides]
MRLKLFFFILLVCVFVSSIEAKTSQLKRSAPVWPDNFKVSFVFSLPEVPESQPMTVFHDKTNHRERIDYYNGLATDIQRGDETPHNNYQVRIAQDKQICYHESGDSNVEITQVLPDLSQWVYTGKTVRRGQKVDSFQWIDYYPDFNKTNTYKFYTLEGSDYPVQFWMMGYDNVFGSHYDEYILDYYYYIPDGSVESDFEIPTVCDNSEKTTVANSGLRLKLRNIFPNVKVSIKNEFNNFINKFGKSYSSQSEMLKRQTIFYKNHDYITNFNKENSHMKLAINHFADLTDEEYRKFYLLPKRTVFPDFTNKVYERQDNEELPDSWDWRDHGASPPVKDQAACGSCWAHAVIGSIESQYYLATGVMPDLSEQMVMDCTWNTTVQDLSNQGCQGGDEPGTFEAIKDLGGIMREQDYPYMGVDGYCGYEQDKVVAQIESYTMVNNTQADAMSAVYNQGVLSIAIDAAHTSFKFYSSGVYYEPECSSTELDHAVLLSGFGKTTDGEQYWIVRNSWSVNWGDQGYVKMSMKGNNCGVETKVVYPTLARGFGY